MMNNSDKLTSIFREKINEAKRSTVKNDLSTVELVTLLAGFVPIFAFRLALVTLIVWLGCKSYCEFIQVNYPTYVQVLFIIWAIKAAFLYFFEQFKKENA